MGSLNLAYQNVDILDLYADFVSKFLISYFQIYFISTSPNLFLVYFVAFKVPVAWCLGYLSLNAQFGFRFELLSF